MKLFGSLTSPYVRHIRIALLQAKLDCDFIETDVNASALGEQSPTKKVPFLTDGDVRLSDSTSILRYIRGKADQTFLPSITSLDLYCLVNTLMDSAINVFYIERAELSGTDSSSMSVDNAYLKRQVVRVQEGLEHLNGLELHGVDEDAQLRLQCFLFWGTFRNRFQLKGLDNLIQVLDLANADAVFNRTAPPSGI